MELRLIKRGNLRPFWRERLARFLLRRDGCALQEYDYDFTALKWNLCLWRSSILSSSIQAWPLKQGGADCAARKGQEIRKWGSEREEREERKEGSLFSTSFLHFFLLRRRKRIQHSFFSLQVVCYYLFPVCSLVFSSWGLRARFILPSFLSPFFSPPPPSPILDSLPWKPRLEGEKRKKVEGRLKNGNEPLRGINIIVALSFSVCLSVQSVSGPPFLSFLSFHAKKVIVQFAS